VSASAKNGDISSPIPGHQRLALAALSLALRHKPNSALFGIIIKVNYGR
jgi:hypothetical protein